MPSIAVRPNWSIQSLPQPQPSTLYSSSASAAPHFWRQLTHHILCDSITHTISQSPPHLSLTPVMACMSASMSVLKVGRSEVLGHWLGLWNGRRGSTASPSASLTDKQGSGRAVVAGRRSPPCYAGMMPVNMYQHHYMLFIIMLPVHLSHCAPHSVSHTRCCSLNISTPSPSPNKQTATLAGAIHAPRTAHASFVLPHVCVARSRVCWPQSM